MREDDALRAGGRRSKLAELVGLLAARAVPPDPAVRDAVAAVLARPDLDGADGAKLSYLVLDLAERSGIELTQDQAAELARLRRRSRVLDEELVGIAEALAQVTADYVLLRAGALGRHYPNGWVRQYNDVDLLLRDERPVAAVLDRLAGQGYHLARPVVSRAQGSGVWLGLALNKPAPALGHPMYLDLTTLGPGLSRTRCLPLPERAWRTRERLMVGSCAVPVLDAAWQAVVFAVELVERRGAYLLRDVLDLAMLDRAGVDWSAVGAWLRTAPDAAAALGQLGRWARAGGVPTALAGAGDGGGAGAAGSAGVAASPAVVGWRDRVIAGSDAAVRAVKRCHSGAARRLVELVPARAWFALGLPVFLLPPGPGPAAPGIQRGGKGRQTAGLAGYRGRIYPLVPPGYAEAAFGPRRGEVVSR